MVGDKNHLNQPGNSSPFQAVKAPLRLSFDGKLKWLAIPYLQDHRDSERYIADQYCGN